MELAKMKLITTIAAVGNPSGGTGECVLAGGGGWEVFQSLTETVVV